MSRTDANTEKTAGPPSERRTARQPPLGRVRDAGPPRIIEQTRQYIRDFDRLGETATTAQELYDKMLE